MYPGEDIIPITHNSVYGLAHYKIQGAKYIWDNMMYSVKVNNLV